MACVREKKINECVDVVRIVKERGRQYHRDMQVENKANECENVVGRRRG